MRGGSYMGKVEVEGAGKASWKKAAAAASADRGERADAPHFPANQSLSPRARGRLLGVGVELQNE